MAWLVKQGLVSQWHNTINWPETDCCLNPLGGAALDW
jgi:hypothetical protein